MNPFLYFVKLVSSFMFTSSNNYYPAVKINLPPKEFYFDGAKNVTYFTACPASTRQEKAFNDRVSLTGNSVFLRNFHGSEENATMKICDKPIEPGIVYNSKRKCMRLATRLLYYEQNKLKWMAGVNLTHIYRRVNIMRNYEVIHNDTNKNLVLDDGASNLNAHWESVLSVAYEGDNKQTQLPRYDYSEITEMVVPDHALRGKCENENLGEIDMKIKVSLENDNIHSNKSQKNTTLPNLEQLKPWNGQSYGSLVMSQLIPLWYYRENCSKIASCSHLNMIPVWKSIEGQLKKVDLFLQAVIRKMPIYDVEKILFGASGVLTLRNEPDIDRDQRQKIYLLQNNTQYSQIVPIPKIIYRVVEAEYRQRPYYAVIVIHNDPIHVLDSERICNESRQLSGWERIKNDDPKTGLTYVCRFNEFVKSVPILPVNGRLPMRSFGWDLELQLDSLIYYFWSSWSDSDNKDGTVEIVPEFEKLLNVTAQCVI